MIILDTREKGRERERERERERNREGTTQRQEVVERNVTTSNWHV